MNVRGQSGNKGQLSSLDVTVVVSSRYSSEQYPVIEGLSPLGLFISTAVGSKWLAWREARRKKVIRLNLETGEREIVVRECRHLIACSSSGNDFWIEPYTVTIKSLSCKFTTIAANDPESF